MAQPEIGTVIDYDYTTQLSTQQSPSNNIWAQFLANIGINSGTDFKKDVNIQYRMSTLKTVYFKSEPSDEELQQRANLPRVRNVLQSGLRSHPVYMISGIKIAENLEMKAEREVGRYRIDADASAPVAEGISLGGNVEPTRGQRQSESFQARQDVVFAYRLLEIRLKGWKRNNLEARDFLTEAAFL
ncbi:hypothetical protein BFW01_g5054 [Lasiodiplodia theobromae]|nr:hypothetical protein BFW01_g5054 [Lasiodiplodia theobromae]